jgi:hypothetical protein
VEPTPTETVPVPTVSVARSGRFQDLFDGDLGGWNRDYTFIEDEPSIYLNQNNQWNIWTADEPFEFWLDQPSQLPVDFSVTLSILQPTTAHGLLIRDPDTEQTFGFYVRQTEDGPWEYEIRQDGSPIISGLSQTYSQDTAPFNRLTITLADEVLLFNINDQENVFGYNYVGKTSPWWNLGLGADAGGHAIIGSARTYFLVPQ